MTIKASGRSALILATGLLVCFASPSLAATGAQEATADPKSQSAAEAPAARHKNLRYGSHTRKHTAHGKSHTVALKTVRHARAAAGDAAADRSEAAVPDLPPRVANANAQLAFPGASGIYADAMSARANDLLQAASDNPADAKNETLIVAADQLNDVDRALRESNPPAAATVMASANPPAAPATVTAGSQDNSTWDQTSLIGKIFIGFGALLTMASAARMFMA
jgi:hypothetical protein